MRIIIINVTAQYGSTGKIAQILKHGYNEAGHQATICYGRQVVTEQDTNSYMFTYRIESLLSGGIMRLLGLPNKGLHFSTQRLLNYLKRENPDLVHVLNLHGYYVNEFALIDFLKKRDIPVIYTMCDEYPYTGKCAFPLDCTKFETHCRACPQRKSYPTSWFFDHSSSLFETKKKLYTGFDKVVFTGVGYVLSQAKKSVLLGDKNLKCVGEPIDLDNIFYPREVSRLRKELGIPDENIVLLAVAILDQPRKGGKYFIDLCNKMKELRGYSFVYVGYNTQSYENVTPGNMIKIPYVESLDKLSEYFSLADLFVSTTLADTVPNAVINALGCGTPVCAFDIGGMSSVRVSDKEILRISPLDDVEQLCENVLKFGKKTEALKKKCRDSIYDEFSSKSVVNNYLEIINELVNKK